MLRCKSCSAPLDGFQSRCGYCGSANDVDRDLLLRTAGEVKDSQYVCPVCGTRMKTVNVGGGDGRILMADKCGACYGSFFAFFNLEALLENLGKYGFFVDAKRLEGLSGYASGETRIVYKKCPVCAKVMNRVNFGQRSGVVTDQCHGHGVWLDSGELKRLVEWKDSGGLLHHQEAQKQMERERLKRGQREKEKLARLKRQAGYGGGED